MADQDLHDDYKGAGFSGRLGFGRKPALLVIDFAKAYLDRTSPQPHNPAQCPYLWRSWSWYLPTSLTGPRSWS